MTNKMIEMYERTIREKDGMYNKPKQMYMYTGVHATPNTTTVTDSTSNRIQQYLTDEITLAGPGDHITDALRYAMERNMSMGLQNELMDEINDLVAQNTGALTDFERGVLNKKILNVCLGFLDVLTERLVRLEQDIEQTKTRIAHLAQVPVNSFTYDQLESLNEHMVKSVRENLKDIITDIKENTK